MALTDGYLVLTKDQEGLIGYIDYASKNNGNSSGFKSRFTL